MPINAPRYYVNAQTQTTPINIVTGTDALTGGTISRVDRGGGTFVFRCTGADSSATFTALAINSDSDYSSPGDSPIVMAVRAIVQTDPSGSFTRFVAFSTTTTPDDGSYIMKNGASNSQKLRSPDLADEVVVNDVIGASLKTIVWRITPGTSGNLDKIEAWVETVGRSGSAPDFTSTGANLTESRMAFNRCIVRPEDGTLDVARIAIFPPESISNADCAALADNFDATIGVTASTSVVGRRPSIGPGVNGPSIQQFRRQPRALRFVGTRTSTGALTGSAATIAGTATRSRQNVSFIPKSGPGGAGPFNNGQFIAAPRAQRVNAASTFTATGALASSAATIAGTATRLALHATTGALAASSATVTGSAVRFTAHDTTGALSASAATLAGVAVHPHVTTGVLVADAATIAGSATLTPFVGGSHPTTGALTAGSATIAGTSTHLTLHATSGALQGSSAALAGTAVHFTLHATSGALVVGSATVAGTATRTAAAVTHVTSGALAAAEAFIAGLAVGPGSTGGGYEDDKPKRRQRWQVQVGTKVYEVATLAEAQRLMDEADRAIQQPQPDKPKKKVKKARILSVPKTQAPTEQKQVEQATQLLQARIDDHNALIEAVARLAVEQDEEEALLMLL